MITTTTPATKVALVTGAFGGIGHATALKLAAAGWTVYAAGRDLAKSTALLAQARASGLPIAPIVLDVTDERSIDAAIGQIAREEGRLDVLVNNAGFAIFGAVTDISATQIRQQFETNVIGAVATSRAALPLMQRNGQGRIINISSVLGRLVLPATGVYAASKFALEALSDAMRQEFTLLGPRFKVIVIEPSFIKTGFADHASSADPSVVGSAACVLAAGRAHGDARKPALAPMRTLVGLVRGGPACRLGCADPMTAMPRCSCRTSTPRFAQVLGGFSSTISSVYRNFQGPTRRVTRTLEPTASGASPSGRADTTCSFHSGWCDGSATYEKTSSGRRDISMLTTIAAISPPLS